MSKKLGEDQRSQKARFVGCRVLKIPALARVSIRWELIWVAATGIVGANLAGAREVELGSECCKEEPAIELSICKDSFTGSVQRIHELDPNCVIYWECGVGEEVGMFV
jgi:hypothetical protein